ncbi:hypothetical protein ACQEU8_12925 [Streptomyces sp. CA-250714]|uniref:hypothetical protein n=1 Tax=Streptomyces sp. CA-250714 TaxID=3240060 RepID=UPI003D8D2688
MTASDDLLHRIENDPALAELLVWPGDFDIERRDPVEELRLPNGMPLYPIAGCGAGGTYFLCGEPGVQQRPVLYADSEGQATLMADDLVEAIRLIAHCPYWRDLGAGFPWHELEEDMRDDHPDFDELRDRLLKALDLEPLPAEQAVTRLRATAARTSPDFAPVSTENDRMPYELLFARGL